MSVNVNTSTNTITVQQDGTRVIQVSTPGPQGQQGPVAEGGEANYIPLWLSANNLTTSSLYEVAPTQVILGATQSVHPGNEEALSIYQGETTSYNLISGHSNVDSYSQLNIKNFNTGSNASADIVATADTGTEEVDFIDMGINGSGYTNSGLVGGPRDAYVYSTGNNLLIGNAAPGNQVVIFNGGTDAASNAKMYIHDTNVGVIGINTDTIGDINAPAALRILPPNPNTFNLVEAEADLNGFVQSVFANISNGTSASSDIVAHNDLGQTFAYYIDMGINSSTYDQDYVGGPNDCYLIAAGEHLHIGNIGHTPGSDASLYLYTGGTTDEFTRVYISASGEVGINTLTPEYQFDVSGSARITDGLIVTGSTNITGSSFTWNNNQVLTTPSATTGTVVSFTTNQVYNEWDVPGTGNITNDLTGAKTGIVQKIYHNNSVAPSVPAGWVVVSNGVYVPNVLNIIYAEWVKGTRVEYWITQ